MTSLTETILDKEPAVMFACFDELPKLVFDKKWPQSGGEKAIHPRRLLIQQLSSVSEKRHMGTRSNVIPDHSKKFFEASERSGQHSIFSQPKNAGKEIKLTKAANLYRISVTSKRFSHKASLTGLNYSLKTLPPPPTHLRHKPSNTTRLM